MASGVQIGTAFIQVQANTTGAFSNVNSAATSAGTQAGGLFSGAFGRSLGGMATAIGGAFAVDKIFGFLKTAVGQASDLNEETSKSQVIFGQSSGAITDWAKGAAKSVGLTEVAALQATGNFGNMFTQLGFTGEQAAGMSKDVVTLAADLGSFNNLPTGQVVDAMSAAFKGEYDQISALIPTINAASVEQEALTMTGKTSAKQLTEQEKAAAILALAQRDSGKATGDFAKTQGGLAGQLKVAEAEFGNMSTTIGTALLPMVTSMMTFVNTTLLPGIKSIGDFIRTDAIPAFVAFGAGFMQVLPYIAAIAGAITVVLLPALVRSAIQAGVTAAASVAGWVTMATTAVANAAIAVGAWIMMGYQSMINAAKMAAAWLIAMGPVPIIIAIVIGLVALIIANWDTISKVTSDIFNNIVSFLTDCWNNITRVLGDAWNNIVNFATNGVNNVRNVVTSVFGAVSGIVSGIFSTIVGFISGAFSNAVIFVTNGVNLIKSFISTGFNDALGFVRDAFDNIGTAVSTGIGTAVGFVSGLPAKVLGALGNLGSTLYSSGQSLIEGFISGIRDMAGNIAGTIGGILETARALFPFSPAKEGPFSGKGYTTHSGKALASDFAKSISAQEGQVRKAASGLMGTAAGAFGGPKVSVNTGGGSSSGVASIAPASSRTVVNNFHVTIDAKNVKDFNSVVDIMSNIQQTARTGRGTQNARVV